MRNEKEAKRLLELGSKIRVIRTEKGYTQTEFANIIGKDQPSVNRLERGVVNPGYLYLCEIADGLGISVKDIL